jgi:hypothetical protein
MFARFAGGDAGKRVFDDKTRVARDIELFGGVRQRNALSPAPMDSAFAQGASA